MLNFFLGKFDDMCRPWVAPMGMKFNPIRGFEVGVRIHGLHPCLMMLNTIRGLRNIISVHYQLGLFLR